MSSFYACVGNPYSNIERSFTDKAYISLLDMIINSEFSNSPKVSKLASDYNLLYYNLRLYSLKSLSWMK